MHALSTGVEGRARRALDDPSEACACALSVARHGPVDVISVPRKPHFPPLVFPFQSSIIHSHTRSEHRRSTPTTHADATPHPNHASPLTSTPPPTPLPHRPGIAQGRCRCPGPHAPTPRLAGAAAGLVPCAVPWPEPPHVSHPHTAHVRADAVPWPAPPPSPCVYASC